MRDAMETMRDGSVGRGSLAFDHCLHGLELGRGVVDLHVVSRAGNMYAMGVLKHVA